VAGNEERSTTVFSKIKRWLLPAAVAGAGLGVMLVPAVASAATNGQQLEVFNPLGYVSTQNPYGPKPYSPMYPPNWGCDTLLVISGTNQHGLPVSLTIQNPPCFKFVARSPTSPYWWKGNVSITTLDSYGHVGTINTSIPANDGSSLPTWPLYQPGNQEGSMRLPGAFGLYPAGGTILQSSRQLGAFCGLYAACPSYF
jgi:hypothetical protein